MISTMIPQALFRVLPSCCPPRCPLPIAPASGLAGAATSLLFTSYPFSTTGYSPPFSTLIFILNGLPIIHEWPYMQLIPQYQACICVYGDIIFH